MSLLKKASVVFGVIALLTVVGEYLVVDGASASMAGLRDYEHRTAADQDSVQAMISD